MSPSPSFNSFSNNSLAEIATRVVQEFRAEDAAFAAAGEFEFSAQLLSSVSADEIFRNGKILPVYPTVHRDSRPPLRKLLAEEREMFTATSSSSSSDVDELDGVPPDTYCVWRPKASEEAGRWKRNSSSKKWKLKDFLPRSFSVGSKNGLFLSSPDSRGKSKEEAETIKESPVGRKEGLFFLSPGKKVSSDVKGLPAAAAKSPRPPYNGDKRRSYLPYRQHQVGFFAFMNGLGKNLQPF